MRTSGVVGRRRRGARLGHLQSRVDSLEQSSQQIARTPFDFPSACPLFLDLVCQRHRDEQHALGVERAGHGELAQLPVDDAGEPLELVGVCARDDSKRLAADAKLDWRAIHVHDRSIARRGWKYAPEETREAARMEPFFVGGTRPDASAVARVTPKRLVKKKER